MKKIMQNFKDRLILNNHEILDKIYQTQNKLVIFKFLFKQIGLLIYN